MRGTQPGFRGRLRDIWQERDLWPKPAAWETE